MEGSGTHSALLPMSWRGCFRQARASGMFTRAGPGPPLLGQGGPGPEQVTGQTSLLLGACIL